MRPGKLAELERLHPRNNTFAGEIFLRLAADALAWSGVSPADPQPLEGMRERFLPEYSGRAGTGASSSTPGWRPRRCTAEPNRTCSTKSSGDRATTSGSTRSSLPLPMSAPPRTAPARRPGVRTGRPSASAACCPGHRRSRRVTGATRSGNRPGCAPAGNGVQHDPVHAVIRAGQKIPVPLGEVISHPPNLTGSPRSVSQTARRATDASALLPSAARRTSLPCKAL